MKNGFFLLALLVTLIGSTSLQAQKTCYVNVQSLLESIDDYAQAQKQLEQKAEAWRQEIQREYQEIEQSYQSYQANEVLMSEDMRKKKQSEIIDMEKAVRDMQKIKFGPEGELFKERQSLVQPIQERVMKEIEQYAKDKGYDFILDANNTTMLYTNGRYDKTEDVKKRLAKKKK